MHLFTLPGVCPASMLCTLSMPLRGTALNCVTTAWLEIYGFVKDWQTLLAALIALGAALKMNSIVQSQLQQAERHEDARLERRYIAARSTLPMVLTEVCRYAIDVTNYLRPIHQQLAVSPGKMATTQSPPPVPDRLFAPIERMIEATENERVVLLLRKIVSEIQILNSRMIDRLTPKPIGMVVLTHEIDINLRQCALIHATSGALFEFARFQSEDVPEAVNWDMFYNSLGVLDIDDHTYQDLHANCKQDQQNGRSPERI